MTRGDDVTELNKADRAKAELEAPTTPNADLAYRVLDHIDAHPELWDQSHWGCGTAACFAGHAIRLSGGVIAGDTNTDAEIVDVTDDGDRSMLGEHPAQAAGRILGLGVEYSVIDGDQRWLFDGRNTREDLGRLVAEIFGPRPEPTFEPDADGFTDGSHGGSPREYLDAAGGGA